MKYSVLMSVYAKDDPIFLAPALRSIYEDQTKKPDEIVIVFDGPLTDDLYQVLNEFAKDKSDIVRYCPLETNQGLGEALRIGSELCTGDYIFRMDADDISHPQRFEKQANYLESHPEIDALGTDIAEFYKHLEETDKRVRACPKDHNGIVKMAKRRNPMNHVSVCMKREALKKSGGYESLPLLEDYYLWLKMIVSGCKLTNLNESLVYVRIGNGFNAKRGSKVRIIGWKTLQQFMLDHKLIGAIEASLNMLYIFGFTYSPCWLRRLMYERILRKQSSYRKHMYV